MTNRTRGKFIADGPPVPCGRCRQPFKGAVVVGKQRKQMGNRAVCPRCIQELKTEKQRKKQENS